MAAAATGLAQSAAQPAIARWRSSEMTPNAISLNAVRPARHDHARAAPHPRRRTLCRGRPRGPACRARRGRDARIPREVRKQAPPRLDEAMRRRIGVDGAKLYSDRLPRVELTHSPRRLGMTGICAKETAGVYLNRTLRIAIAQCRADVSLAATAADLAIVGRLPMRPARVRRDRAE